MVKLRGWDPFGGLGRVWAAHPGAASFACADPGL